MKGEGGKEKEELIGRILELQNTLHDLTQRVNSVKEENSKLKSENEVRERGRGKAGEGERESPFCVMCACLSLL